MTGIRTRFAFLIGVAFAVIATAATFGGSAGGTITTIAGTNTAKNPFGGFSGDGGPATSALLDYPSAVAVDAKGNVYIADSANQRVRKVSPSGTITTIAGSGQCCPVGDGGPATSAGLYKPRGVAVDRQGNLYIADPEVNRVRKVSPAGTITTFAGGDMPGFSGDGGPATSARLSDPWGVATDGRGNVYIGDTGNQRVRKVSPSGTITTIAGNGKSGYSGDGSRATSARMFSPHGVAVDAKGDVYIADNGNFRVRKVSPSGTITTIAGNGRSGYSGDGGRATSARLFPPSGVAVDAKGDVYIAESTDHLRAVSPSGTITTIAGSGRSGYSGDGGPPTKAELWDARGVAVDGKGRVYIADAGSERVRKVTVGSQAPARPRATLPATSPGNISGRCSKAAALTAGKRAHLAYSWVPARVFQVLCGAFAGSGSRVMVASYYGPGNTGVTDWVAFRFVAGKWQQLLTRHEAVQLSAAGPDFRETMSIYRSGDSRCCPSGGTRFRVWHWNGTRLVAGPWTQVKPAAPSAAGSGGSKSGYFKTPSGNIQCDWYYGTLVRCGIKSGLKPVSRKRAGCYPNVWVELHTSGAAFALGSYCRGEDAPDAGPFAMGAVVLGYGKTWSGGGLSCASAATGLTCRNKSGRGFFLSREKWRQF